MNRTEKPWGYEELLENNNNYSLKRLFVKAGHACSLQFHNEKHETIYVLEGTLRLFFGSNENNLDTKELFPGEFFPIAPKTIHRMQGITDSLYLEASTSHLNDLVRLKDDYGRL